MNLTDILGGFKHWPQLFSEKHFGKVLFLLYHKHIDLGMSSDSIPVARSKTVCIFWFPQDRQNPADIIVIFPYLMQQPLILGDLSLSYTSHGSYRRSPLPITHDLGMLDYFLYL